MGLWRGDYRGMPLGWRSPVARPGASQVRQRWPTAAASAGWPASTNCCAAAAWPRTGRPARTSRAAGLRARAATLHGRIANQPAHVVEVRVCLDPPYELSVAARWRKAALFCPHLRLTTTYTTVPGSNRLVIHDVVENRSRPAGRDADCSITATSARRSWRPAAGCWRRCASWRRRRRAPPRASTSYDTYAGPSPGFAEQVYLYDLLGRRSRPYAGGVGQRRRRTGPWPCASTATSCPASRCGRTPGPWRTATSPAWSRRRTIRTSRASSASRAGCRIAAAGRPMGGALEHRSPRHGRRRGPRCWPRSPAAGRGQGHRPSLAANGFFAALMMGTDACWDALDIIRQVTEDFWGWLCERFCDTVSRHRVTRSRIPLHPLCWR